MPGVLLRVVRPWTRGVILSCRFAVGFQEVIIPGASEICGMVRMGSSSITLCSISCVSAALILCCSKVTLCSEGVGGGASNDDIRSRSKLRIRRPLGVML